MFTIFFSVAMMQYQNERLNNSRICNSVETKLIPSASVREYAKRLKMFQWQTHRNIISNMKNKNFSLRERPGSTGGTGIENIIH